MIPFLGLPPAALIGDLDGDPGSGRGGPSRTKECGHPSSTAAATQVRKQSWMEE